MFNKKLNFMTQNELKQAVARAAVDYVEGSIIGVGTGSTANYFIEELGSIKNRIQGAVASSKATAERLEAVGIKVVDLNSVSELDVYIDGADEITEELHMVKGGGGALTREKIVSAVAKKFICIADEAKLVSRLGKFPLPIEVIPMAQSLVERELIALGGKPVLRNNFVTDNGNVILDIHGLDIDDPISLEGNINQIPGVVTNGLFALKGADVLLLGKSTGVKTYKKP